MSLTSPKFWEQPHSWAGYLLEPLSWLYQGGAALHHLFSKPCRADVPVISIGNFVMGGAGKTPVARALAQQLQGMGRNPHIISRGYGGALKGPVQVDLAHHSYHEVGDEPLLLAQNTPTWVSKDRRAAVNPAIKAGADILLLDDAHQNRSLEKDMCLVVVNGLQRFGNGRVFPAGPLRQSLKAGLKGTTAIIFMAQDNNPLPEPLRSVPCPVIRAKIVPINPNPCAVFAFTGIGYPEKFRQTLVAAGYDVKAFSPFPDHYPYTEQDLRTLRKRARVEGACLMTTEKDAMRIPPDSREGILVLPIGLVFEPATALESLLRECLKARGF
ncbi:MAG: lpxK [Alphaproteobacteria bacterium]|nr:lpxK [Alphaproteobacteria bacterium]